MASLGSLGLAAGRASSLLRQSHGAVPRLRAGAAAQLSRNGGRGQTLRPSANAAASGEHQHAVEFKVAGSKAFLPSELPAIVDLFQDYATLRCEEGLSEEKQLGLDRKGLQKLLAAVGERPSPSTLEGLFRMADADGTGSIDLGEFLAASDSLLGNAPAKAILVVGGPGSGKGLLCERLVADCGVSHVSCGELLREEVAAATPTGLACKATMERGELIASSTILKLLNRKMRQYGGHRLLLDGFPRSRENAVAFEEMYGKPELALYLTCPDETMLERIESRAREEGRADDTREAARVRIETFRAQGEPTLRWLRDRRVPILELDASGTPEDVWGQLLAVGRLMRAAVALSDGRDLRSRAPRASLWETALGA